MNQWVKGNATSTWIVISFLVASIISVNTYLTFDVVTKLAGIQFNLDNTGENIMALDSLHLSILAAESGQRGYLLTKDELYLKPYIAALDKVNEEIKLVNNLTSQITGQKVLFTKMTQLTQLKLAELIEIVELAKSGQAKEAIRSVKTDKGRDLYAEINQLFTTLVTNESEFRQGLYAELGRVRKDSQFTFIISISSSLLLVIVIFYLIRANVRSERARIEFVENQNEELTRAVALRTKELDLYAQELSRSNRELEDFAFVASHDLQEPLRKIQAFGDRLETQFKDELGEKGSDYLSRMRSAASRMAQLITDLLEFSRVSTKGKPFIEVDLNVVLDNCLEDLSIAIEESNALIHYKSLPIIKADNSQMHQLFLNLIANALKFRLADKQPEINLTVKNEQRVSAIDNQSYEDWIIITISDNGIGFEQNYADKIFAPFQRLHGRREFKGTGIGLAVCKRIVERHGGTITAIGEPNVGATFVIALPAMNTIEIGNNENDNE